MALSWLLPLLYVLLALTLVSWAGMRHSNRTRRGRALFVFTIGIVLIVLASAFFFLRAVGTTQFVGVGAAATLLGCAMLVVAAGSLLPSVEDWFGARRELRTIQPLLDELGQRHPDVGIGVRPRGPLVFRVAERMSLISDALFLEATAADAALRHPVDAAGHPRNTTWSTSIADLSDFDTPDVAPRNKRVPSRSGSMRAAAKPMRKPNEPCSRVWDGYANRPRTPTGSGFLPSPSSTGSSTGRVSQPPPDGGSPITSPGAAMRLPAG